ncbi:MAG: hypothetical protein IJF52_06865 [Clostridia bacterium]|nr:hypothetical protein [Clostridia bacterium]
MKSFKISFPLVHKKSSLPTLAALLAVVAAIPVLMVLWVAVCSAFTRVEGTNETALYNVYVWVRAIFAITLIAGAVVYDLRRASVALLPGAALGLVSSVIKFIIAFSTYLNKKALADALSISSSYTQNYIDIAEAALLLITSAFVIIYLLGILKTAFPVIFAAVISALVILYSVISYSTTYEASDFTVLSRCYAIPCCIGLLLFCLSSKTKAQLEGKVKKEKYVPRRMRT